MTLDDAKAILARSTDVRERLLAFRVLLTHRECVEDADIDELTLIEAKRPKDFQVVFPDGLAATLASLKLPRPQGRRACGPSVGAPPGAEERRLGRPSEETAVLLRLPAEYRRFLTSAACLRPRADGSAGRLAVPGWGTLVVQQLLRLDAPDEVNFMHYVSISAASGIVPKGMVLIGLDAVGNPICISCRDDCYGAIYVLDHELAAVGMHDGALVLVRKTFAEFLVCLSGRVTDQDR
jgi:hypothetical protein